MALVSAYSQTKSRRPLNALIVSHFDGHGVAFAAARYRVLCQRGEAVEVVSKFPATGPRGLSDGSIKQLLEPYAPQRYEFIDIPIDVRNPDASIKTLQELASRAPVYYYDHHETDVPFIPRLHKAGIFASVFGDNVAMAAALELLNDPYTRDLAIIGMVADRDSSVLKLVSKEQIEREYLPLANKLDILVRQPQTVNTGTPGELAKMLAQYGIHLLHETQVEYPPERIARELISQATIAAEGTITLLVDWAFMPANLSMWLPKTLEQLLLIRGKYIAIAVVPAYNPRTRTQEGYDVRILRYWLAPSDIPVPEQLAKELIEQKAIHGQVVGHADYVSIRFTDLSEARRAAELLYRRAEGSTSTAAHLVNDQIVANAVRRDFQAILEKLSEILEKQTRMYEEYLKLKEKQVDLLERTQRHEYD